MKRLSKKIARWLLLPLLVFITGCAVAHLPMTGSLPDGVLLAEGVDVDAHTPVAFDPKGECIAFADNGLRIRDTDTGRERLVSSGTPISLAWSRDGKQLAAAFVQGKDTVVRLYERQGSLQAETLIYGRVTGLAWCGTSDLLVFAVRFRQYTFGAHLGEVLYRWDGRNTPAETPLYEATLKPVTMRQWGDLFQRTLSFRLSPLQDEILYIHLHDPPAFIPYMKLVLRNLVSGKEREVAEITLSSSGAVFSGDGEYILYGDGEKESQKMDPWGMRVLSTIPTPGMEIALSPAGRYFLLDGRLYRDGKEIAAFPVGTSGVFAEQGGRLALLNGERLYLVSGLLEDMPAPASPAVTTRIKELRRWLSEGLLTVREYRSAREKIVQ
jgi:hypothetical protein